MGAGQWIETKGKSMSSTLIEMFRTCSETGGDKTAYIHRDGSEWKHTSFRTAARRVADIGSALIELGVQPGERVAILANSRIEWALCDFAILGTGAIVVPIYQTNSPAECEYILANSEAKAVVVENAEQLAKISEVRAALPQLQHVIIMDPTGVSDLGDTISLDDVETRGRRTGHDDWTAAGDLIKPDDLATLIYTSGTTGPPKGCMLSHHNYAEMTEMVVAGEGMDIFQDGDRIVLFLPLAHTFARLISFVSMRAHLELAFSTIATLMDDLGELKPTLLPSVPRVFEKAYTRINGQLTSATGAKKKLVGWAMKKGKLRGKYIENNRRVPPVLAAQYALAHKLVFHKIHDRFGGNLRLAVSGGAPLSKEVQEFFLSVGIIILEGYGLTESTTAITLNRPDMFRCGSVGPLIPGTEVKIAEDKEILISGPQVFQGYYKNPDATAEVLSDGWLHTGDIGVLEKNFLYITDRKKDIIVTAGGKNISPQNIENGLKATQYVSQALVYGDKKPFITALITLDPIEMETFADEHKLPTDMFKLIESPEVHALVQSAVDHVNEELGRVEQIKRFRILPIDFTQETGELTPTLKLKRKAVCERYQQYIDAMYEDGAADCEAVTDSTIRELQVPVTA